ncbi:MAG TPA: EamA family transporter RarD [Anaerolineales bacterium]|nr:EamA family transporter RarD [Anaerolineales bacterium]HNB37018.1 EamA family transporter RarD [Anaerolineales bacterium]
MNKGILSGIAAYAMWGFFPIYWKLLHNVPAVQLLGHRISWSFLLLVMYILVTSQWKDFRASAFKPNVLGIYAVAGVLLSLNWLIYVWGVNAGYIVETSLGYFINPLLSVLLGVFFLREKLRPMQWVPVVLATIGVIYLTITYGRLPWIALSLAVTFGLYGFVKKLSPLGSVFGLTLETGIVFPIALIYLSFVQVNGTGAFLHDGPMVDFLLIGGGIVTTIPLIMFATAAKQIPLNMIGVLQYFAPTIQFLIGVFLYKEPFDSTRFIGFGIVWLALIVFWVENFIAHRTPVEPIPELGEG